MLIPVIIGEENVGTVSFQSILTKQYPQIKIVSSASGEKEVLEQVILNKPGAIFLDTGIIDIQKSSLLTFIKKEKLPSILALDQSLQHSMSTDEKHLFFLPKPIMPEVLKATIKSLCVFISKKGEKRRKTGLYNEKILFPQARGFRLVSLKDIIRLEAVGNYTQIFLCNGSKIVASKQIGDIEPMLHSTGLFFRTHRSHIINLSYLVEYDSSDGGCVIMKDGTALSLSRGRHDEFFSRIQSFARHF